MKVTKDEVKTDNKELTEAIVLWVHKSKNDLEYLSGNLSESLGSTKVVGYFNTNKKNPKEPDIRIYTLDSAGKQDVEIVSLWDTISKADKRYLTGKSNENEQLIGFYEEEKDEKKPYIKVYFK